MVDDNALTWAYAMRHFDNVLKGGRQPNRDRARLKSEHNQGALRLEVRFPASYPRHPCSVRIVKPNCVQCSGQVAIGDSTCIEALMNGFVCHALNRVCHTGRGNRIIPRWAC
ncbi:hypothetical protein PBRA_003718 [Plasmodiophora brassicae]|uniref:UBC core domain-containing protein n=1 Tax=Plasmodiophora brassicae TaxID=37360 RepID=A0A0G4IIJ1_PLABS|nr:hypothetical protein PBRA_003718 [Plasmodiophora brassicae]